jgi:hypothetical protein
MTPDCERVVSHLGEPLSSDLLAHAQSCAECQKVQQSYGLLQGYRSVPGHDAPGLALPAAAAVELRKHPHARPWWWGALALALTYLALILVGVAVLGAPQRTGNPPLPLALQAVGIGLALLSIVGFVASLAPRGRRARLALFPFLGALLFGILLSAPLSHDTGGFVAEGMSCLTVEVVMSLLPIGLGIWLLTRSAFNPIRSLLLPFCGATAGLVVLCFHCRVGLASHLLVFHLAPWLALGALAWAVRAKSRSHSYAP